MIAHPLDALHAYEAQLAHRRLLLLLKPREHRIHDESKPEASHCTAVRIGARSFRSIASAARAYRCSAHTVLRWLDDGKAVRA